MINKKLFWFSDCAVIIFAVITAGILSARGDSHALVTCLLTIGCVCIIHGAFHYFKFPIPYFLYCLILLFIMLAMIFGKMLGFYGTIPLWDFYLHLVSGSILAFVGYLFFYHLIDFRPLDRCKKSLPGWFVFLFSSACAGIWEIFEFSSDFLLGLQSQGGSLTDTMTDIIAGNVGCLIALVFIIRHEKGKQVGFLSRMLRQK